MDAHQKPPRDVQRVYATLNRFDPRHGRLMGVVGGLSFANGVLEASVLALITSAAVTTADQTTDGTVSLGPVSLDGSQKLWAAIVLLLLSGVTGFAWARLNAIILAGSSRAAREQLLTAFQAASYQKKSGRRVASLQESLTTHVDRFASGFNGLLNLTAAGLNLASYAFMAVIIDLKAALVLVLVGGLVMGVQRPASRRSRQASAILLAQRRRYAEGATEAVLLSRELAVFGVVDDAGDQLLSLDLAVTEQIRLQRFWSFLTPRLYQFTASTLAIIGLTLLARTSSGDLTGIAAVAIIMLRSLSYGQNLVTGLQTVAEARPYIDDLVDLIEEYRDEARQVGTTAVGELNEIEFRGTDFAYEPGTTVLHDFDLTIRSGETIGVVGPSGAGKTTFANLLLRMYEPTGGEILVNGVSITEVEDAEWHRRVAVVPQEPRLIHGTIGDNIRFFREIDEAEVRQAAAEANIADFIEQLPLGYDSPVGDLGQGLSGGQKQRICIARALAGTPDLLVLDEPTSALDGESEAAVQRTLEDLQGRVTMVIVAHRLSTLAICDRIVVVDRGTIAAVGTQSELRDESAYFRDALGHAGL